MQNTKQTTNGTDNAGNKLNITSVSIAVDSHLKLVPLELALADQYLELVVRNQDRLGVWFSWARKEQTLEQTKEYLGHVLSEHNANTGTHMGIFFDGKLIGQLSLTKIDLYHRSFNASGWVDKDYEGHGVFFKAGLAVLNFAFTDLGLNRLEARAVSTNARSHKLISQLRKEGTLMEAHREGDNFLDVDVYSLLKSEWAELLAKIVKQMP